MTTFTGDPTKLQPVLGLLAVMTLIFLEHMSGQRTWLRQANCLSRVQRKMWCPVSLKCRRQSRMPSSFSLLVLHPLGSSSGLQDTCHRFTACVAYVQNGIMEGPDMLLPGCHGSHWKVYDT